MQRPHHAVAEVRGGRGDLRGGAPRGGGEAQDHAQGVRHVQVVLLRLQVQDAAGDAGEPVAVPELRAVRAPGLVPGAVPRHPGPDADRAAVQQAGARGDRGHQGQDADHVGAANLRRLPDGGGEVQGGDVRHHGRGDQAVRRRLLRVPLRHQGAGAPPGQRHHPGVRRLRHGGHGVQAAGLVRGAAGARDHQHGPGEEADRADAPVRHGPQGGAGDLHQPEGGPRAEQEQPAARRRRVLGARPGGAHQGAHGEAARLEQAGDGDGGEQGDQQAVHAAHGGAGGVRARHHRQVGQGERVHVRRAPQAVPAGQGGGRRHRRPAARQLRPHAGAPAARGEVLPAAGRGGPRERRQDVPAQ
mmetsp:Transcript_14099/g.33845  ORF Transcript_14099/g.33845 Transcript_14099/m.33845 type:complete len:357 (+) Transcript_14099:1364-2434(+)